MKKTGNKKPELISVGIRIRKFYTINIDPTQKEDGTWEWDYVELSPGIPDKKEIIEKLVSLKYPVDKVASIFMSEDLESKFDYEAFQGWKEEATRIADTVLKLINERG